MEGALREFYGGNARAWIGQATEWQRICLKGEAARNRAAITIAQIVSQITTTHSHLDRNPCFSIRHKPASLRVANHST